jgi:prepilin-type N-terminal cleavage/methylation domain-containing protein
VSQARSNKFQAGKSESGFSLIELMTVVAIVALLAIIVIPNYSRFHAKARATESKSQLAALFAAETAFHAEFNSYHTDAANVGYRPQGILRYVVGFNTESTHAIVDYFGPALTPANFSTGIAGVCAIAGCTNTAVSAAGLALTAVSLATTATMSGFNAAAEGFVGGNATDIWSINELKQIANNNPGGY